MSKVKLLSSAPMSTPIVCGVYQARRNDSEGFLSIRGTAAEGLPEESGRPATPGCVLSARMLFSKNAFSLQKKGSRPRTDAPRRIRFA